MPFLLQRKYLYGILIIIRNKNLALTHNIFYVYAFQLLKRSMSNYVSKDGLERLKEELHNLKTVKRREIAAKIEHAKELGDLSENAEYQDAKDELAFVEGHIIQLEDLINHAVVIEEKRTAGVVSVGSTVRAMQADKEVVYSVVGSNEADPRSGKISNESPLGQAFLGKSVGEEFLVKTPAGEVIYKVVSIE